MAMLQVVVGIVFVLLLLSLLATTVMELLSGFLGLRGQNLEKALQNMLSAANKDEQVLYEFKDNALYKQLSYRFGKAKQAPSYVPDEKFQSILFNVILKGEGVDKLGEKIKELPDGELKNVLLQLLQDADHEFDSFKAKVKDWYNDVMDRASGWYKRSTQKILVFVGLVIAVAFNADTLAIYQRLESDPVALQQTLVMADQYVAKNGEEWVQSEDPQFQQSYSELRGLISEELQSAKAPLGIGWVNVDWNTFTPLQWVSKILGWLVTALAVSLGAPFWFDLLKKLVNIRSSGDKPS